MIVEFDRSLHLSRNFQLFEMVVSEAHPSALRSVILTESQILKLYYLCQFGLQKIRDVFGYTKITSGYRTLALNKLVNGSDTSQHLECEAADFVCVEANLEMVFRFIREELKWTGQCFHYKHHGFIHLALPRPGVAGIFKTIE